MGYSVTFYAVDLAKLRAAHGCRDKALLRAILDGQREEIEEHDATFEDEIEDGAPSIEQALKGILGGKCKVSEDGEFQYGYALEFLCRHFGRRLVIDGWGVSNLRTLPFPTAMMANGAPLPVPAPEGDFPEVGHLSADEVCAEAAATAGVPSPEDPDLAADVAGYRQALAEAAGAGLGLVAFRY